LENWLVELYILCRSYGLLIEVENGEFRVVDLERGGGTVIGIGLDHVVEETSNGPAVRSFLVNDSILDGLWPVDTPDGIRDQREVQSVHRQHDEPPR